MGRTIMTFCFALVAIIGLSGCSEPENSVVVYTALDEMYSRPILNRFEQETGIRVEAVYDTEAAKTTGLVNRLEAEKDRPRADVFWNNEVAQTILLQNREVIQPYRSPNAKNIPEKFKDPRGYWTGLAARGRVIIYNTELTDDPPTSILDFTKPEWSGKVAMAMPIFGTTATHASALFVHWGDQKAQEYFQALKDNDVAILAGNATVRDMVARGEYVAGMTDTDDANGAVEDGFPVKWLFHDQGEDEMGALVIPNSLALIANCPHPKAGKALIDYLLRREVEEALAATRSIQIPLNPNATAPDNVPVLKTIKTMDVDFETVAAQMPAFLEYLKEQFAQ